MRSTLFKRAWRAWSSVAPPKRKPGYVVKRLLELLVRSRLSGLPLPLPVLLKRRLKRGVPGKRKRVRTGPPLGVGALGLASVEEIAVVAAEGAVSVEIAVVAGLAVLDKRRWGRKKK